MAAQLPDRIILDGEEMDLYSNPLEQYWASRNKKRPAFQSSEGCRRGYICTWELKGMELLLKSIAGEFKRSWVLFGPKLTACSVKKIFPRSKNKPVKATWYSGRLRIPAGKMTRFDDNEYDSRFERDIIVSVAHGNIVRLVTLDNTEHSLMES